MKRFLVISLIFSLLFILSCEDKKKSNDELLIGYWELVEKSSIYEGDCEFIDGHRIRNQTDVTDYSQSILYKYLLFNDDKTFSSEWNGKTFSGYRTVNEKGTYHLTGGVISFEYNSGNNFVWDIGFEGEDNFNLDTEEDCGVKGKNLRNQKFKRKN